MRDTSEAPVDCTLGPPGNIGVQVRLCSIHVLPGQLHVLLDGGQALIALVHSLPQLIHFGLVPRLGLLLLLHTSSRTSQM